MMLIFYVYKLEDFVFLICVFVFIGCIEDFYYYGDEIFYVNYFE